MTEFLTFLLELVKSYGNKDGGSHWVELVVITLGMLFSMGFGGLLSLAVSRRKFRKRAFFDQMVIGVNILHTREDGRCTLKLRTLVEDNLDSLLDNPILRRMVEKAAKRCTEGNPILELADREDHALLLTKIQNAISRCFAKEYLLCLFGKPMETQWAEFVVTCERYGGLKATKIRVLVFTSAEIRQLLDPEFYAKVFVEHAYHADRLRTLRMIASTPLSDTSIVHGRVEIPFAK